jgi:two-component system, NarL family, nitrate/nitrite response regulator NarL
MSWTQPPIEISGYRRLPVSVCDTQPIVIEGLKSCLAASGVFAVSESARSLDDASHIMVTSPPRVMIVDKAFGSPAVLDWISRMAKACNATAIVVWGASMNESEALGYLKVGARGILRKTAEIGTLLACLENVADGCTWMEDSLFLGGARSERQNRMDLTPREQQVLELVEQGLRNKEIARELGIRPGTVKIHLKHIFEKTGVRGRYGLALSGLREKTASQMLSV